MQEIDAKIIKKRIISSDIFVSESLAKTFELSMNCRAQMKTPKDENDRSVLLNIELSIDAKGEELKIKLVSDFIFECSQVPDDYNELAEQNLTPMAMEALLNDLDEMLVVMGYKKWSWRKKFDKGRHVKRISTKHTEISDQLMEKALPEVSTIVTVYRISEC